MSFLATHTRCTHSWDHFLDSRRHILHIDQTSSPFSLSPSPAPFPVTNTHYAAFKTVFFSFSFHIWKGAFHTRLSVSTLFPLACCLPYPCHCTNDRASFFLHGWVSPHYVCIIFSIPFLLSSYPFIYWWVSMLRYETMLISFYFLNFT